MTPTNLAVVSDTHINSTVAVCPPRIEKETGTHTVTRPQRWLWECWQDYATEFYKLPGRHIVILNGDVGELDTKKRSLQLISTNKAIIQRIILDTIEPLIADADAVYVIKGTPAHSGKSSWLEEWLAGDLDNATPQDKNNCAWDFLERSCEGARLNIGHHASMSGNKSAKLNAAAKLAEDVRSDYTEAGQLPPHLVIRSHNHRWADTFNNFPVRVLYTGAFTFATEYIYRTGKYTANKLANIGGYYVTCDNGAYVVKQKDYPVERRNIWAMQM